MTTLEIVLLCSTGLETIVTAIWSRQLYKKHRQMMLFCADRVIRAEAKYDEYNKALGDANVWINTR